MTVRSVHYMRSVFQMPHRLFLIGLLALVVICPACKPEDSSSEKSSAYSKPVVVDWPRFGPKRSGLQLNGHTNNLPDFVGPVDGSARLIIFTEGNHFPVLLPLVFEEFPAWCAMQKECDLTADQILVVTLPQVMIVKALTSGVIRAGNATMNIVPGKVYPHLVMGGEGPLRKLCAAGIVQSEARVFARHRGMGLLVRRDNSDTLTSLENLVTNDASIILATPNEAGARRQYQTTMTELLGKEATERILDREVRDFPGRLGIQHRDVPFALLHGYAKAGLIFGHLADFYTRSFPEKLYFVPVDEAAPFGQNILLTYAAHEVDSQEADLFNRFFMERARNAYPDGGFTPVNQFAYGKVVDLCDAPSIDNP